jgi:NTE family protein
MKIGLALGGGGARGAAHLGVLYELRELGIKPDLIAGTSIGGIIGAFVASGTSLEVIEDFLCGLSLSSIFTLAPTNLPGIIGQQKGEALLVNILGRPTFAELKIPLSVVAIDLISRREVILREGDLITALLATSAVPVLAPPVDYNGMKLVDGGVLNNVPFDIARANGATHVIAVDLSQSAPYGTPSDGPVPNATGLLGRFVAATQRRPLFQLASTVSDILTTNAVRARMAIYPPDLLIQPKLGTIGLFDFHHAVGAIEAGREAVRQVANELEKLKAKGNP